MDADDPLSNSAETLPDGVDEAKEKTFKSPLNQRDEGQPSPKLRDYLCSAAAGCAMTSQLMILILFVFFISEATSHSIAEFTNAKTTEIVYKKR